MTQAGPLSRTATARLARLMVALVIAVGAGCGDKGKARSPAREEDEPSADAARPTWRPTASSDAGASDEASAADDGCAPGLLSCGESCVDPALSNEHCGACDRRCTTGMECIQRRCTGACPTNTTRCGLTCKDLGKDPRNCGSCGTACFPDQVCNEGRCGCAEDKTVCAGVCVEPQLGLCGPCGKDCPEDLPCEDGAVHAADWPTLAADMSRTGYNQGEQGTPPLSDGWAISVTADPLSPVLVSGARVFVSGQTKYGGRGPLFALDLDTGATLWKYDFGMVSGVGQATLANCRVYVQSNAGGGSPSSSRVWAIRADTGEAIWSRVVGSAWSNTWSPAVTADGVYVSAQGGALSGFGRKGGNPLFSVPQSQGVSQVAAAVHGPHLYMFLDGKLQRHDAVLGSLLDTINVKWNSDNTAVVSTPVFSPEGVVYLVAPPTLYAFEAISKRLLWSHAANMSGVPALAQGRVIAFDSQLLTSFDAKSGSMQWRNLDAEGLVQTTVAAAGYAYAASKTTTYAVDLRDGSVLWSAKVSGLLSIGGGRLFVASSDGILHSYVLTQPPPAAARVH